MREHGKSDTPRAEQARESGSGAAAADQPGRRSRGVVELRVYSEHATRRYVVDRKGGGLPPRPAAEDLPEDDDRGADAGPATEEPPAAADDPPEAEAAHPEDAAQPSPLDFLASLADSLGAGSQGPANPLDIIARSVDPGIAPGATPLEVLARSADGLFGPAFPMPSAPRSAPAAEAPPTDPQAAFWQLWLENHAYLRKQSLRLMSGNMADAEDALSSAMLKASQKFADYAGTIVNERAWLSRLVHNVCMDFYRSHKRQARLAEETVLDDGNALPANAPPACTPEEEAEAREALHQLKRELDRMPEKLREPFLMRFVHEMSYAEISERLGLSNCAVRKRIQLAREFLRDAGIR